MRISVRSIFLDMIHPFAAVSLLFCSCDWSLTPSVCGDGLKTFGEECDDGNTQDDDGCSSECRLEEGYPMPPTGLVATGLNGSVTLEWNQNTEEDLAGYNVKRSTTSGGPYTTIGELVTEPEYQDDDVTNGVTYYYIVTAENDGQRESSPSNEAQAAPSGCSEADGYSIRTESPPEIDGSVDDAWAAAPAHEMALATSGYSIPSDFSGSWRSLWDDENLYFLVEIEDDTLINNGLDWYQDDTVEIFLDADNSHGSSYDGVNDFQFGFRYDDPVVNLGDNSVADTTGIVFILLPTAEGYTLEVAIPWNTLGVTPSTCHVLGAEVQVDDDDDGGSRDSQIGTFTSDRDCYMDPRTFGSLALQ